MSDNVPSSGVHGQVELRFPATSAFVAILRGVTAGVAARCDLTVDEIEDLRIAVDEACALLLPHATDEAAFTARFRLAEHQVDFIASVPTAAGAQPDRTTFAWTVLDALTDDLKVSTPDGELSIALTKRRAALPQ